LLPIVVLMDRRLEVVKVSSLCALENETSQSRWKDVLADCVTLLTWKLVGLNLQIILGALYTLRRRCDDDRSLQTRHIHALSEMKL
jgi:hypothetical protein